MKNKLLKAVGLVVLFQLTLTGTAQAAIFKCVNAQDEVFYHDKPCPVNHEEESLKHIKDPKNSAAAAALLAPVKTGKPSFNSNGQPKVTTSSVNRNADKSTSSGSSGSSASSDSSKAGLGPEAASLAGKGTLDSATGRMSYKADELPKSVNKDNVELMSEEEISRLSPLNTF